MRIFVPAGKFASEEDDAAERRRRLAKALMDGEEISVSPTGNVLTEEEKDLSSSGQSIVVPEGKLA